MMHCPECAKSFTNSDGVVTHLSNAHGMSRIEARKQVISYSQSTDSNHSTASTQTESQEAVDRATVSAEAESENGNFDSDREEMLHYIAREWQKGRGRPTRSDLNGIPGYDADDYVDEFGSIFGAATLAEKTSVDPNQYSHTADGAKQYSEWELISAIWRLYELTGKASSRMMDDSGPYSLNTYQYRFGSWSEALEKAHIQGPEPSVESSRQPRNKHYASADWQELRSRALERDNHQCQSCGMTEEEHQEKFGTGLNVHHITDVEEFDDPDVADTLENVETLCAECHGKEHPFSNP